MHLIRPSDGHTTQPFGNTQPDGQPHAGTDYAYTDGNRVFPEVWAAAAGVVLFAGDSRGMGWPNIMYVNPDFDRSDDVDSSAGNYVVIDHDGLLTGYGHLEEVHVAAGDHVSQGQQIGVCGQTGNSRGKHLHFDVVDPALPIDRAPYYGRVDPEPFYLTITPQATFTQQLEGDKMIVLATNGVSPQVWAGDGIWRRPVWTLDTMTNQQWLARNKVLGPFYQDGAVQTIPDLNSIGIDMTALVGKDVNGLST